MWTFDRTIDEHGHNPVIDAVANAWACEPGSARFVRSSANMVYTLTVEGQPCFLRVAPGTERQRAHIVREIVMLEDVRQAGLVVAPPVPSRSGSLIETVPTVHGEVHAVVFEAAKGRMKQLTELDDDAAYTWGETVGRLHLALANVSRFPMPGKSALEHAIDRALAGPPVVHHEARRLAGILESLPRDADVYGLIHADPELDNITWDDGALTVLDFDDAGPGWYIGDIAKALDELIAAGETVGSPRVSAFLHGYRSIRPLGDRELAWLPDFVALQQLAIWAILDRSIDLAPTEVDQPWMIGMLGALEQRKRRYELVLESTQRADSGLGRHDSA
jgi:Ser/Thr protein kinase RdoA (MazF antagonist)